VNVEFVRISFEISQIVSEIPSSTFQIPDPACVLRLHGGMPIPTYTRREFCVHSFQTASLAAMATALTGCGSGSSGSPTSPSGLPGLATINTTILNNTMTLNIDAGSPLSAVGTAALVNASGRSFLVAHTGANTFTALTAVCTHEQCTVSTFQTQMYECPCHGSQYSTTGSVLRGPATRSLTQFTTAFSNNVLTITTG
jgi:cytochrome b6-f complex iron-sulfur subunit